MDELEVKRMAAILDAHAQFEIDQDTDGTMTTVAANPIYEFVTAGWRVEGRDAVYEMYRRLHSGENTKVLSAERRSLASTENTLYVETLSVREAADGTARTCRSNTVVLFEGDLVAGERVYSDAYVAQVNRDALGEDFGDVPGVSRL